MTFLLLRYHSISFFIRILRESRRHTHVAKNYSEYIAYTHPQCDELSIFYLLGLSTRLVEFERRSQLNVLFCPVCFALSPCHASLTLLTLLLLIARCSLFLKSLKIDIFLSAANSLDIRQDYIGIQVKIRRSRCPDIRFTPLTLPSHANPAPSLWSSSRSPER